MRYVSNQKCDLLLFTKLHWWSLLHPAISKISSLHILQALKVDNVTQINLPALDAFIKLYKIFYSKTLLQLCSKISVLPFWKYPIDSAMGWFGTENKTEIENGNLLNLKVYILCLNYYC